MIFFFLSRDPMNSPWFCCMSLCGRPWAAFEAVDVRETCQWALQTTFFSFYFWGERKRCLLGKTFYLQRWSFMCVFVHMHVHTHRFIHQHTLSWMIEEAVHVKGWNSILLYPQYLDIDFNLITQPYLFVSLLLRLESTPSSTKRTEMVLMMEALNRVSGHTRPEVVGDMK